MTAAGILGGCMNARQFDEDVAQIRAQWLWLIVALAVVALALLGFGIWRDAQRRGTYLGVLFGALGEIALLRHLPVGYRPEVFVAAVAAVILSIVLPRIWRSGLLDRAVAPALVAETLTGMTKNGSVEGATPNSGLVAYVVTFALLLLFDLTISSVVYSALISLLLS
jgi:uncharacterized membrane protein YjjB (DUF3815 family)